MKKLLVKHLLTFTVLALALTFASTAATAQTLAPWHHYYNNNNHFYTTNWGELGGGGSGGWVYQGVACYVVAPDAPEEGTHPLYRFFNTTYGKHFYTTDFGEVSGSQWVYEGVTGHLFSSQLLGTVPLHRWYRWLDGPAHYYTTSSSSLSGWTYEGVIGYVSPS